MKTLMITLNDNTVLFSVLIYYFLKHSALAGVAQRIECGPVNQRVTGWSPSQGTCLCCGLGPQ